MYTNGKNVGLKFHHRNLWMTSSTEFGSRSWGSPLGQAVQAAWGATEADNPTEGGL